MKPKIALILSLIAGLLAFLLTLNFLNNQRKKFEKARLELNAGVDLIEVVGAGKDLPVGTVLTANDLGHKSAPSRDFGERAVLYSDFRQILGKKLKYAIRKDEIIQWQDLDIPYAPGSGLAPTIKPGLRAVSISVGGAATVSGLVQPNDRVDILGTFALPSRRAPTEMETVTLTILQDVSVLAVGQTLARQSGGADATRRTATSYSMVTFEVTPREAELLVFTESMKGRLTLVLRNPEDMSFEKSLPSVDFQRLEQSLPELNEYRQRMIRHKRDF
jgi:pilus assembly protein CpaB